MLPTLSNFHFVAVCSAPQLRAPTAVCAHVRHALKHFTIGLFIRWLIAATLLRFSITASPLAFTPPSPIANAPPCRDSSYASRPSFRKPW